MDLRLNLSVHNAALRLASLPTQHPLFKAVRTSMASNPRYFKSPLHKLFRAFPNLANVETIDSTPPETTRRALIDKIIASSREEGVRQANALENTDKLCVFSDGSGEGGWVGAAAVAAHPLGGTLVHRARLGSLAAHTVFEGELYGILLALRIVGEVDDVNEALILLDNQAAITRAHEPRAKSGQVITDAIIAEVAALRVQRPHLRLSLVWVPGHEDVVGNELADEHAKMASAGEQTEDAMLDDERLPDSIAARRAAFKQHTRRAWQARWADSERGRRYARFDRTPPSPKVTRMYRELKRADAALLTQLRTGHVALNQYLGRIKAVDSQLCARCGELETVDHYLLRCPRFLAQRGKLRSQLKGQILSTRSLLGSRKNLSALMAYIHSTGRLAR